MSDLWLGSVLSQRGPGETKAAAKPSVTQRLTVVSQFRIPFFNCVSQAVLSFIKSHDSVHIVWKGRLSDHFVVVAFFFFNSACTLPHWGNYISDRVYDQLILKSWYYNCMNILGMHFLLYNLLNIWIFEHQGWIRKLNFLSRLFFLFDEPVATLEWL